MIYIIVIICICATTRYICMYLCMREYLTISSVTFLYCRGREKLGVARVSKAYEFYETVKEHLLFQPQMYTNKAKNPFEATNYVLYYFAADENDAEGKECDFVLDRSAMWDNTAVDGSSKCYEFVGLDNIKLKTRHLPCPCENCCVELRFDMCLNIDIVGAFTEYAMREISIEAPEYLQRPIGVKGNTIKFFQAFLKRHNVRFAKSLSRPKLIDLIESRLGEYLLPVPEDC